VISDDNPLDFIQRDLIAGAISAKARWMRSARSLRYRVLRVTVHWGWRWFRMGMAALLRWFGAGPSARIVLRRFVQRMGVQS